MGGSGELRELVQGAFHLAGVGLVAVEIQRIGTIEAGEQLTRHLDRIRDEPGLGRCRGVLAAQTITPQARTLAETRGIARQSPSRAA